MNMLETIKSPLSADLVRYEEFMRHSLSSGNEYVSQIMDYIVANRGKGIRPIMTMLMAGIHSKSGQLTKRSYLAAMLVELIHTASLVHDDVIDHASIRHGKPSVNALWGSRMAVVTGDYILAKAFTVGMGSGQYDIVNYVCNGISELCVGEMIQDDQSRRFAMSREVYFDIIQKKTAVLLGISCGAGALSSGVGQTESGVARQVGIDLGMAFQIKDDVLDFAPSTQTGKPTAVDLTEHKITLPLLMLLEQSSPQEREELTQQIRKVDSDSSVVEIIGRKVVESGAIEKALGVMQDYIERARQTIATYPESEFRRSMLLLCDFIGKRDK